LVSENITLNNQMQLKSNNLEN